MWSPHMRKAASDSHSPLAVFLYETVLGLVPAGEYRHLRMLAQILQAVSVAFVARLADTPLSIAGDRGLLCRF